MIAYELKIIARIMGKTIPIILETKLKCFFFGFFRPFRRPSSLSKKYLVRRLGKVEKKSFSSKKGHLACSGYNYITFLPFLSRAHESVLVVTNFSFGVTYPIASSFCLLMFFKLLSFFDVDRGPKQEQLY